MLTCLGELHFIYDLCSHVRSLDAELSTDTVLLFLVALVLLSEVEKVGVVA